MDFQPARRYTVIKGTNYKGLQCVIKDLLILQENKIGDPYFSFFLFFIIHDKSYLFLFFSNSIVLYSVYQDKCGISLYNQLKLEYIALPLV